MFYVNEPVIHIHVLELNAGLPTKAMHLTDAWQVSTAWAASARQGLSKSW